jgi:hypothetical protein
MGLLSNLVQRKEPSPVVVSEVKETKAKEVSTNTCGAKFAHPGHSKSHRELNKFDPEERLPLRGKVLTCDLPLGHRLLPDDHDDFSQHHSATIGLDNDEQPIKVNFEHGSVS